MLASEVSFNIHKHQVSYDGNYIQGEKLTIELTDISQATITATILQTCLHMFFYMRPPMSNCLQGPPDFHLLSCCSSPISLTFILMFSVV